MDRRYTKGGKVAWALNGVFLGRMGGGEGYANLG